MDDMINKCGPWKVGDRVKIRPSQQLYWKLQLGSIGNYKAKGYAPLEFTITNIERPTSITTIFHSADSNGFQAFNRKWVDWNLEGNKEEDYASRAMSFMKLLNAYPHCQWCHEPIQRHIGGEFDGHWEHLTAQQWSPFYPDIKHKNYWSCSSIKTIDQRWHVAEHPFRTPYSKKVNSVQNTQPVTIQEPIITATLSDVLVLSRGRRFKTIA